MRKDLVCYVYSIVVVGVLLIFINSCSPDELRLNNLSLVDIPGGTFTMGSPANENGHQSYETEHQVTLSSFRITRYEITNAQFASFLNAVGVERDCKYAKGLYPRHELLTESINYDWGLHYNLEKKKWEPMSGYEDHPVIWVTWYGATEFANYVGGNLPTEAQWEYACRGKTTTTFNTGNCLSDKQANYNWSNPQTGCSNENTTAINETQKVGSYFANAFGLYDMHGNVLEWCSDWFETYPVTAQTNPTGPSSGYYRICRGGDWSNSAQICRSAHRAYSEPAHFSYNIGFRVVFLP